jgi:hypothetical protein
MEGIKIEIGERERRRGGDDVSRNVSPPTTATGDEVDYGVAHTQH